MGNKEVGNASSLRVSRSLSRFSQISLSEGSSASRY